MESMKKIFKKAIIFEGNCPQTKKNNYFLSCFL